MGGFMGVAAKQDCVFDLYFGIDYHSHLGTRRGGMVVYVKCCCIVGNGSTDHRDRAGCCSCTLQSSRCIC